MAGSSSPLRTALAAGALLLVLTACSSTSTSAAKPGAPAAGAGSTGMPASTGSRIVIDNFAYTPMDLTVSAGQKVTVVNHDSTAHTLTADDKSFDTGTIAPGKSGTFTAPGKPGSYTYICDIHQFMHGTVTVH